MNPKREYSILILALLLSGWAFADSSVMVPAQETKVKEEASPTPDSTEEESGEREVGLEYKILNQKMDLKSRHGGLQREFESQTGMQIGLSFNGELAGNPSFTLLGMAGVKIISYPDPKDIPFSQPRKEFYYVGVGLSHLILPRFYFEWMGKWEEDPLMDDAGAIYVAKVLTAKAFSWLKYLILQDEDYVLAGRLGGHVLAPTTSKGIHTRHFHNFGHDMGLDLALPFDNKVGMEFTLWRTVDYLRTSNYKVERDSYGFGFKFNLKL